ncbi:lysosomal proton-coupled steroid conjugate and bile acid symporter SLC46A3-like [Tigriopus californicus]|nr:lysosomal proton-coupled steroid conjugate and bile acid symporter SLC46A3-like [Tigriopus californicus]
MGDQEESKASSGWKAFWNSITIEPMLFIYILGGATVTGAALNTNLLIRKICLADLHFNETVCDHLDLPENDDYENEVQLQVNNFQMIGQWIGAIPALILALFAGGLSDDIGRKPLLIVPLVGSTLTSLLEILNLVFIDVFPTQVFFVEQLYSFFGGMSVYYMGFYGYGSSASNPKERTTRLARFDGVEQTGSLIGTLLSPVLFSAVGYLGCYSIRAVLHFLALVYMIFIAKEPHQRKGKLFKTTKQTPDGSRSMSYLEVFWEGIMSIFIRPIIGMIQTVLRDRPKWLRLLLWIQLFIFAIYWFLWEENAILYLYALKCIPGYDGTIHSFYQLMMRVIGMLALLFVMPLICLKAQVHEGLILICISFLVALGTLATAFATNIWQFFVCQALLSVRICQYSTARSMMTKCISPDEVGKLYSFIAVIAAIMPILSNPAFRQLYNATLKTFPSAFLLFGAALSVIVVYLNFFIYSGRKYMLVDRKGAVLRTMLDHDLAVIELKEIQA